MVLASLLVLIQYPLWVGHGSWLRVWDLDRQLALQQEVNAGKRMRNEGLEAEAADLRSGTLAIEERARYELGMVKRDEIFVQFNTVPGEAGGAPPASGLREGADGTRSAPSAGSPSGALAHPIRAPGEGGTGARGPRVEGPAAAPPDARGMLTIGR